MVFLKILRHPVGLVKKREEHGRIVKKCDGQTNKQGLLYIDMKLEKRIKLSFHEEKKLLNLTQDLRP